MRHSFLDNLRLIAEYVYFDDAPGLLGVAKRDLTKWVKGKGQPPADVARRVAGIAGKMRRREAQLKHQQKASDARQAKRDLRAQLRLMGRDDIKVPDYLPPFLRQYEMGKLASPVYIYDFREMKPNDVLLFFRMMKRLVPSGYFFLTYEVQPGGTSAEGNKKFWNSEMIKVSTTYQPFCVGIGNGNCLMMTDLEFLEYWEKVNDRSAKRRVIECGVSYPRPIKFTEEEMEEDRKRGADPLTGLVYIWQD